jgi:hypothetical protein
MTEVIQSCVLISDPILKRCYYDRKVCEWEINSCYQVTWVNTKTLTICYAFRNKKRRPFKVLILMILFSIQ